MCHLRPALAQAGSEIDSAADVKELLYRRRRSNTRFLSRSVYAKSSRRSMFGSMYRSGWLLGPKGRQRRQGRCRSRWSGWTTWTARTGRRARQGWQRRRFAVGPIPGGTIGSRRSYVQTGYVRRQRSDRQRHVRFEARIDESDAENRRRQRGGVRTAIRTNRRAGDRDPLHEAITPPTCSVGAQSRPLPQRAEPSNSPTKRQAFQRRVGRRL
jgi:hypothetical protein